MEKEIFLSHIRSFQNHNDEKTLVNENQWENRDKSISIDLFGDVNEILIDLVNILDNRDKRHFEHIEQFELKELILFQKDFDDWNVKDFSIEKRSNSWAERVKTLFSLSFEWWNDEFFVFLSVRIQNRNRRR